MTVISSQLCAIVWRELNGVQMLAVKYYNGDMVLDEEPDDNDDDVEFTFLPSR